MQLLREVLMEREPPLLLLDVACPLCPLHGPGAAALDADAGAAAAGRKQGRVTPCNCVDLGGAASGVLLRGADVCMCMHCCMRTPLRCCMPGPGIGGELRACCNPSMAAAVDVLWLLRPSLRPHHHVILTRVVHTAKAVGSHNNQINNQYNQITMACSGLLCMSLLYLLLLIPLDTE